MSGRMPAVEPDPDGGPSAPGSAGEAGAHGGSRNNGGPDTGTWRSEEPWSVTSMLWQRLRRPFGRAVGLYRRSIQLRIVATTLVLAVGVVALLGIVVMNQVRNGLLNAKKASVFTQAVNGMTTAKASIAAATSASDKGQTVAGQGVAGPSTPIDMGKLLTEEVTALANSGAGAYYVVGMVPSDSVSQATSSPGARGARVSGSVDPDVSIPASLRTLVGQYPEKPQYVYTSIAFRNAKSVSGIAVGVQYTDKHLGPYQLYYLFPFTQEESTLNLVGGTLASAGVFVVVLLGGISWLVVRQVVTPVRMAAEISEWLASGRLEERMKVSGTDDIARLGESFNRMAGALQAQIRQLEELSRVQRRFVSDVSHELRTPLTTVRMAADLLYESREDFGDPATERAAELLQNQLDRFESLLADLLEISRFDAGAAILDAEPADLRDVVTRVVDGAEPLAKRKGSAVHVIGAEEPVVAEVDPRRIERILRNLVVNALEHGEGRDIEVRLASGEGAVAVAVRDHGIGLKPGEAARVFNRFWRADPARARTTGGTGLGLSIALEDAALHGGWLQAWGEPGGGSQFRLTVPQKLGQEITRSPIALEPADSRSNRGLEATGMPYRRPRPASSEPLRSTEESSGGGLGAGLGGVLGYGSVIPRTPGRGVPASNPADVRPFAGFGSDGGHVVVSKEGRDEDATADGE
ncbi:MtrAB system histidine kinase MtrB [Streptacidiphilus monticola]|uniref:Sensor histidine kinase MtrB n=1 Tax=Streptacidiphilus monticola TaxID=2161674 RepID=A0ABW1G1G4_9ACTN